jgi:hypothetical protein
MDMSKFLGDTDFSAITEPKKRTARKKKEEKKIAVIDFETDPFLHGRDPRPFAAGFYDGSVYLEFWGDDCVTQLIIYLESRTDPLIIYAHNGGKFDFFFLLEEGALENPAMMINGRIVKCRAIGIHEMRDSYAMMPVPLRVYQKLDIEYSKLEREVRDVHRGEISEYLRMDCVYLFELVEKFIAQFGAKLTVGAAAISEVQKFHPVPRRDAKHDQAFRPYYFGGRVECFEKGKITPSAPGKKLKIFDVNSMYPQAMSAYDHPASGQYVTLDGATAGRAFDHATGKFKGFGDFVYFMHFTGINNGALPVRLESGGIAFDQAMGDFYACSHEIKAAIELKLITVLKIHSVHICTAKMRFTEFVSHWGAEKARCKAAGDKAGELFAKLMLNSAYGKMATDPTKFKDYYILDNSENDYDDFEEWKQSAKARATAYSETFSDDKEARRAYLKLAPKLVQDAPRFEIWECGAPDDRGYFDVAIGASITSAARSILLRAIHACERPLYCDTDSLICEALSGVEIHDSKLGAWKFEGETDLLYVAGKKMYAAMGATLDKDGTRKDKIASKGAKLSADDIAYVAMHPDEFLLWKSDAPNFKLDGRVEFIERKIRATA